MSRKTNLVACLAVIGLAWACENQPTDPGRTEFPLSSNVEPAAPPPAGAAMRGPGRRHGPPMMLEMFARHADELGLSADQRSRIEAIAEKAREDARTRKDWMKGGPGQMHALLGTEPLDEAGLAVMHAGMQAMRAEMETKKLGTFLDALEVLTGEQRVQLIGIMDERKGMKHDKGMKQGKQGHGPDGMLLDAMGEIDQTDEQKAAIDGILARGRDGSAPLRDEQRALREEMHEMLAAPELDRTAIESKHAQIMAVEQKLAGERFDSMIESLEVLTAEQRAELVAALEPPEAEGGCKMPMNGEKPHGPMPW